MGILPAVPKESGRGPLATLCRVLDRKCGAAEKDSKTISSIGTNEEGIPRGRKKKKKLSLLILAIFT